MLRVGAGRRGRTTIIAASGLALREFLLILLPMYCP
jgi:hypothetical protein